MPASLLVEQRKMKFYNKTLHINNIVLRILQYYIEMRPENSNPYITSFLDTRVSLTLKGQLGLVCKFAYNVIT